MTFSITGRCARTGMFGVAITTSSISVGSRCPHARAGVGAVATQNITDPNLAALVLDQMEAGSDAGTAIATVIKDRENIDFRQLTAVDANGKTAFATTNQNKKNNKANKSVATTNSGSATALWRPFVAPFLTFSNYLPQL